MKPRYFEVKLKNGNVMILTEREIERYRTYVDKVRTEMTEDDIPVQCAEPLTKREINLITQS